MAAPLITRNLPKNPGPAGWNRLLPPAAASQTLSGDIMADWLIIGGGFAGRGFGIDALRNVRALRGQVIVDEDAFGVKHIIVVNVADPADGIAHDLFDVELGLGRNFTADADEVAFNECLASDPAAAILREAGVKHSVGYSV